MFCKIVDNARWLLFYSAAGRASWLLTMLLVASAIGEEQYGEVTFYVTFWLIINRVVGLGIEIWINRRIASNSSENKASDIARALTFRSLLLAGGLIVGILVVYAGFSSYFSYLVLVILVALRQFAESMREVLVGVLQGYQKMRLQTLAMIPWDVAQLTIVLGAIFLLGQKNPGILMSIVMLASLGKIVSLYRTVKHLSPQMQLTSHIGAAPWREIVAESSFVGMGMLSGLLLGQVYVMFLRTMTDARTVGAFAFAYLFIQASIVLLGAVRQAMFPALSRLAQTDRKVFISVIHKSMVFFILASALLLGLLQIMGFYVLPSFFGDSFTLSMEIIKVLSWVLPFVALAGALGNSVLAAGLARRALQAQLIGIVVNIVLNYALISKFGWIGVFWAMVITYLLMTLQYWNVLLRFRSAVEIRT